jgi:prepilin-type N-terminal cleavage/methylation domain-containing protein
MRRRQTDESGFTLIEVLVAALIMVIGVLGAMGGFIDSSKASQTAQRQDVASALATQAIEQIRELPYASQAVDGSYPGSPGSGPLTSISGSNFTTQAGQAEPLVSAISTSGIDPVTYLDAQTGVPHSSCAVVTSLAPGDQCATIYRFISWRKETCPTISLATLLGPAGTSGSLLNQISTLSTTVSQLTSSISVDETSPIGGLLGGLLTTTGLTGVLNSTLGTLDTSLNGLSTALAPAQTALSGELTTLQSAISGLPGGSLTTLDLCSLPNLNLDSLGALATALSAAQNVLASTNVSGTLAGVNTTLNAIATLNLTQLLGGVLGTLDGTLNGASATINSAAGTITSTLGSLANELGSTKNLTQIATDTFTNVHALATWLTNNASANVQETKRISVAVVLNTAGSEVGVRQPVWVSSVSTDPTTGLFL